MFSSNPDILEKSVFEFDSIFDDDFDIIDDEDYIVLKTDYNYQTEFWSNNGTQEGAIYTKQEAILIKNKLCEIIKCINVPPENIKDREKIIYAQIVQELAKRIQYDFEVAKLIDENKEIYYDDTEYREIIDSTQNMKGLLDKDGKTVCKGMSTIINAISTYFGISSQTISNNDHAWNLLTLDGEKYEDDFTWNLNELKTGNIPRIAYFLRGSIGGKREFDALQHHNIENSLNLSQGVSTTEQINLLATDWSNVQEWENVNISKTNAYDSFMNQLTDFVKNMKKSFELNKRANMKNESKGRII